MVPEYFNLLLQERGCFGIHISFSPLVDPGFNRPVVIPHAFTGTRLVLMTVYPAASASRILSSTDSIPGQASS